MMVKRIFKHLIAPLSPELRDFRRGFQEIETAISESEVKHSGQICFAVEPGLELSELLRGVTSRQRAEAVFSVRRVWDTADNNGVLIYLLLAERSVEIVADRGICEKVKPHEWQVICRVVEDRCRCGDIKGGVLCGVEKVSQLLLQFFPQKHERSNTVSDRPIIV